MLNDYLVTCVKTSGIEDEDIDFSFEIDLKVKATSKEHAEIAVMDQLSAEGEQSLFEIVSILSKQ